MLIDGLEWCGLLVDYRDVFIRCLNSHSDGTHSLQRIHWRTTDVMLHFSKSESVNSCVLNVEFECVKIQMMLKVTAAKRTRLLS